MNVLSLFNGISCGRLALERSNINVDNYYSSEIDKYTLKIADKNYPEDIKNKLGDIKNINCFDLPNIDLLIGGSPCVNFSFSGKQKGMITDQDIEILSLEQYLELKDNGFEFKGYSYLFWEYMRILKETKPKYFLLENVKMSKKWENILSQAIGIEPIKINSSLVSAQNRIRNYWTNIPNITQPKDRNIILEDILEYDTSKIEPFKNCVRKNIVNIDVLQYLKGSGFCQIPTSSGFQDHKVGITKSPCLRAGNSFVLVKCPNGGIRKITVLECERLQTIPDNFTEGISNTQRFKAIGNGWTVDVISHIFNHI